MKNTKKSLLASGLALLASVALLAGTTFAWFTDSVTNSGNRIQAGSLKINAYAYKLDPAGDDFDIPGVNGGLHFGFVSDEERQDLKVNQSPIIQEMNWEPGQSSAKLLKVENAGTLAAKISLQFDILEDELTKALWFDFIQVNEQGEAIGGFERKPMADLEKAAAAVGELPLGVGESLQFILVYGMLEEAGNEYQEKAFQADVAILAAQDTVEPDGFNNPNYDEKATYDEFLKKDITTGLYVNTADPEDTTKYVADPESLQAFADYAEANVGEAMAFALAADVDMAGETWDPVLLTSRTDMVIEGNGHTISGMGTVVEEDNVGGFAAAGFIGELRGGSVVIKDLSFENVFISVSDGGNNQQTYAGVVIGHNSSTAVTLENITVSNCTVVNHWQAGGLVGYSSEDLTFSNCHIRDSFIGGSNATAGTLFGLGIVSVDVKDCTAENVELYTDGLTWNSAQKRTNTFWIGDNYEATYPDKTYTVENSTETNVTVVSGSDVGSAEEMESVLEKAEDGDYILVDDSVTFAQPLTIDKSVTVIGGARVENTLSVTADSVVLDGLHIQVDGNMQAPNALAPVYAAGKDFTLKNCTVERTTNTAPAYGLLVIANNGTFTAENTVFIAPYDSALAQANSPSVIEATGGVNLKDCVIRTNGYGIFDYHVTKGIISNTVFEGLNGQPIHSAVNSTCLNGLVLDGCTFRDSTYELILNGNFTIQNCDFQSTRSSLYMSVYGNNGAVVLKNNTFALNQKLGAINFTWAKWTPEATLVDQVEVSGNVFNGQSRYAVRYTEKNWSGLTVGENTFNGNAVVKA